MCPRVQAQNMTPLLSSILEDTVSHTGDTLPSLLPLCHCYTLLRPSSSDPSSMETLLRPVSTLTLGLVPSPAITQGIVLDSMKGCFLHTYLLTQLQALRARLIIQFYIPNANSRVSDK